MTRHCLFALLSICITNMCFPYALAAAKQDRPHIILCMADDQGWGDVAYNGHPVLKTPHLDDMAKHALRFDHFYAAAPVCTPTRGSVMTGRHPNRFACFKWGHTLRPKEITVAEALKKAGYATGHFGKWHLGSVRKGSPVNPGASGFDRWLSAENFYDNNPVLSREGKAVSVQGESSIVAADAAIEFIREQLKANSSQPILAVVWFGSPHSPHRAAAEDAALYESEGRNANFLGEITGIDRAVGKLRKELRTLKIHENTLFWYCSDNGGLKTSSSGGRGNKGSVYEGGLRVPCIIEWPAQIPQPRITKIPSNTIDILPTLLDAIGADPITDRPVDGISLVPTINGKMESRSKPMGFWDYPAGGVSTPSDKWMKELLAVQKTGKEPNEPARLRLDAGEIKKQYSTKSFPGHSAWNNWPWKLHRIQGKNGSAKYELYNLAKDPYEKNNLASKEADRVDTMKKAQHQWLVSVVNSLNGKDFPK
jgi:arylsulfatase A-like enzyme